MSLSELLLIAVIALVLFDTKQLIQLCKIAVISYKKIVRFLLQAKSAWADNTQTIFSSESSNNYQHNYIKHSTDYNNLIGNYCTNMQILYQPELNFDAQPELFDGIFLL
jgi:Sec-independent protein translocase protein TatA